MTEREVDVETPDGPMYVWIVEPGSGPAPGVVQLMDASGVRDGLRDMARRYCEQAGVAVALPDLFHRWGDRLSFDARVAYAPGGEQIREQMIETSKKFNGALAIDDVGAVLDFMDGDDGFAAGRGLVGYCMGGRAAIEAAGEHASRITAISALHPSQVVTDGDDSPHLALLKLRPDAGVYIGCGGEDFLTPPPTIEALREAGEQSPAEVVVEVTEGASHGFSLPGKSHHDEADARHWEHTIALFKRLAQPDSVTA